MSRNNFLYYILKINRKKIVLSLISLMLLNMSVFYNNTINEVTNISIIRVLSNILGSPTSFITVCIFLLNMNSWHFSNYVVSRFNNRKIFFSISIIACSVKSYCIFSIVNNNNDPYCIDFKT